MNYKTRITISGIVQGVGFRPFLYHLANKYNLKGFCLNNSQGILIEVHGEMIEAFIQEITTSPPPLSKIEKLTAQTIFTKEAYTDFHIRESVSGETSSALISPDISLCQDCLAELFNPQNRRYRYPFINCINCGPRYSIIRDIPYDRSTTTMASFIMCDTCKKEYHDPGNRRFHAQPNACPACGPHIWLTEKGKYFDDRSNSSYDTAITTAKRLLKEGAILAIKGLGGFHLVCDATNRHAVKKLREKKRRSHKPFALMAPDISTIQNFCIVSEGERVALEGRVRPIVILKKIESNLIADAVAPDNKYLGVMLPYTPLHYLLFDSEEVKFTALVMTSGNLSEEPIVVSNNAAIERLSSLADFFLFHDRDIFMRVDDSLVKYKTPKRVSDFAPVREAIGFKSEVQYPESGIQVIRRARGFVPATIDFEEEMEEIFACGAELKNTFCLTKGNKAILSQHIGDLQNYGALEFFKESLNNLKNIFHVAPRIIAHDLHPDYLSTKFSLEYAKQMNIPDTRIMPVQHHHAHIVSCMAEYNIHREVIGVAFDGTGYGPDGNMWGGEFLIAKRGSFARKAHLQHIAMPGGDRAAKEPWRMAIAYLYETFGDTMFDIQPSFFKRFSGKDIDIIVTMIKKGINSPRTSSTGRLFDAISSLLQIRDRITFEAEAAIQLEMIADGIHEKELQPYPYQLIHGNPVTIDLKPLIKSIGEDINKGVEAAIIAANFHDTLANIIVKISHMIKEECGLRDVVLSGGVFQNELLLNLAIGYLEKEGFTVWHHKKIPPNDGGISLGQAVVAWERTKRKERKDFHKVC